MNSDLGSELQGHSGRRYRLLALRSVGTICEVFFASRDDGTRFILKRQRAEACVPADFLSREANRCGSLKHIPNIVVAVDEGIESNRAWIAIPYIAKAKYLDTWSRHHGLAECMSSTRFLLTLKPASVVPSFVRRTASNVFRERCGTSWLGRPPTCRISGTNQRTSFMPTYVATR